MVPRNLRWLSVAVLSAVGLAAFPARSSADTLILVQELSGSGAVLGSSSFTIDTLPTSSNPFTPTLSGGGTASFRDISITVNTTSGVPRTGNSLSTTVNAKPSTAFDASHQLRVIVTDDGFLNANAGGAAVVTNDPGLTDAVFGGLNENTGRTELLTGTLGSLGSTIAQPADATEVSGGGDARTTADVAALPGAFAIRQTLTIRGIPTTGITADSTFTDSLSSKVESSAPPPNGGVVPAPAGLVLALTALPALGLRRLLRRKSVI
jgi:hypothetical protein